MNSQDYLKRIGSVVRKARKEKGLSLESMAFDNDISYSTLSRLERGELENLTVTILIKVVNYLRLDIDILLSNISPEKQQLIQKIINSDEKELSSSTQFIKNLFG
jgi:transcriptional regulator with XRE-family HTH domain